MQTETESLPRAVDLEASFRRRGFQPGYPPHIAPMTRAVDQSSGGFCTPPQVVAPAQNGISRNFRGVRESFLAEAATSAYRITPRSITAQHPLRRVTGRRKVSGSMILRKNRDSDRTTFVTGL